MGAEARATSVLPPGRVVAGRWEIDSVIGEGASGVVYLAREQVGGAQVALKVIHPHLCHDRQIYGRFQREASILKRLEGPHLVKLLDFVEERDVLVIALEYVRGTSLEALLESRPVTLAEAVEITLQVAAALGAAHAAGVVHRDLKPANVLVEEAADGALSVRVVDFGLAKVVHGGQMSTGLTEQDMIFGTPEYMAPEQARGDEVDARCDIYAAGIMLYEMAVGQVPFRGRTPIASMTAHLTEPPRPPREVKPDRGISPALEVVILRALAKDPDDRYPSARVFAEALASATGAARVIAKPHSDDADGTATSDTDLSLSVTGLEHRATLPVDEIRVLAARPVVVRTEPSGAEDLGLMTTLRGEVSAVPLPAKRAAADRAARPGSTTSRWLWTLVAILALGLGVAIGTLVGAR